MKSGSVGNICFQSEIKEVNWKFSEKVGEKGNELQNILDRMAREELEKSAKNNPKPKGKSDMSEESSETNDFVMVPNRKVRK